MSDSSFWGTAAYVARAWADWKFKRRIGMVLVSLGVTLFIAAMAGFAIGMTIPTDNGPLKLNFSTEGTPQIIVWGAFGSAIALIVLGIVFLVQDRREESRKRVIAIEVRGLRDTSGQPLSAAIPASIKGRRELLLVNLRQGQDGTILEPATALRHIQSLPQDISRRESGVDRADISYVMGGLAPVPLNFLVGVLTDDEGAVTLLDWDRNANKWRELDAEDDHRRFQIGGLKSVPAGCSEVALAVSVSYGVDLAGIASKLPATPLVGMTLEAGTPNAHWSEDKQQALAQQFHETAIALGNKGVRLIHLFLAAQNSVVLRFGRTYDKRNLPSLIVYQYEQGQNPPFPWGIRMPVQNTQDAEVVT